MNIIKSKNDSRDYKLIKLENGIDTIIIKDKKSTQCGALLNINVGSISDNIDGIAHFLEHMVFMGSKKYPDENNFMDSIIKNGGYTNAMTGDIHTTYYFTMEPTKFISMLDKFANFFMTPLLKKENIEREVNAVNAEAMKNITDDNWILHDIIKKGMTKHPFNHFSCGNNDTLKGDNLHKLVRDFFDKNYSANLMNLIIFINDDIDEKILEREIYETFGKITNKNNLNKKLFGKILNDGNIIKFIPNKDINVLDISIEVPKNYNNLIDDPSDLLYYILNNKGPNSLYQNLDKKGYITSMECNTFIVYDDYKIILIELRLTDKGFKKYMEIYEIILNYINSIRKSKYEDLENLYNDIQALNHRLYILHENSDIIDTILDFNYLLIHNIKPENLLNWTELKPLYKDIHNKFIQLLDSILEFKLNLILGTKNFEKSIKCELDKIYNVYYCIEKLESIKLTQEYKIIGKNPNITNKIPKLLDEHYETRIEKIEMPEKYTFVYNFDYKYNTPLIDIFVTIKFPKISENAKSYIETVLYLNCAYSKYSEELSLINNSPYNLSISLDQDIIYFYIKCDSDKINDIFKILYLILNYKEGHNFINVKNKFIKSLKGFKNELPTVKIKSIINKTLEKNFFTPYELLKVVDDIQYDSCVKTFDNIKSEAMSTIFISGNIKRDFAIECCKNIYSHLEIKKEFIDYDTGLNDIKTPYKNVLKNHNDSEKNSIVSKIYEIFKIRVGDPEWQTQIVFIKLLNTIMYTQFFNILRTKEQLGYILSTQISYQGNFIYKNGFFKLLIQSPIKNGDYLLKRVDKFLDEFYEYLQKLNENDFNDFKQGELSILKDNYTTLSEYNIYLYSHIIDQSFMYDYKEKLISEFDKYSLDTFIQMYENYILKNNNYYEFVIDSKHLV